MLERLIFGCSKTGNRLVYFWFYGIALLEKADKIMTSATITTMIEIASVTATPLMAIGVGKLELTRTVIVCVLFQPLVSLMAVTPGEHQVLSTQLRAATLNSILPVCDEIPQFVEDWCKPPLIVLGFNFVKWIVVL